MPSQLTVLTKNKNKNVIYDYDPIINFLFLIVSCGYAAMQRNNLYISQVYGQKLLEAHF